MKITGQILLGVLLIALMGACKADDPAPVRLDKGPIRDLVPRPDIPTNCNGQPPLPAPIVDGGSALTTTQLKQPVRGTAIGAARIVANTSMGGSYVGNVSSGGSFCVEVDLQPDTQNNVILTPYSALGCPGNTTSVTIQHRTVSVDGGGSNQPVNLAPESVVTTDPRPEPGGTADFVVDDDASSWSRFSIADWDLTGSECDEYAQILLDLKKVYVVTRFEIEWGPEVGVEGEDGEDHWASCYAILTSEAERPSDPSPTSSDWTMAVDEAEAAIGKQTLAINPRRARWVALWLYENGGTDLYSETFDLAELRVVGQDPDAPPPLPQDRCE